MRQRRRQLATTLAFVLVAGGGYVGASTQGDVHHSGSLLSCPLHFPTLAPGSRCPASSGYRVSNP